MNVYLDKSKSQTIHKSMKVAENFSYSLFTIKMKKKDANLKTDTAFYWVYYFFSHHRRWQYPKELKKKPHKNKNFRRKSNAVWEWE